LALVFAQVLALAEFKRYTSRFQFVMIIVSALILGIQLDLLAGLKGELTTGLLASAGAIVLRQAYMRRFTYSQYLWVEPVLMTIACSLLVRSWLVGPFTWQAHLLPIPMFASAAFLSASYLQDGIHLRRKARGGYRVDIGKPAPDFVLPDQHGRPVRLSDHIGQHPVLLIFVRGDWCPGCHMMLRTYERNHEKFRTRGIHVMGIGPDSVEVNKDMVERIGVGYDLLSDQRQAISKQYGVLYANPVIEIAVDYALGVPLPASFLVDVDGIVRYVSRPDKVGEFLDPHLIFSVLDQLPQVPLPTWKAA
jgi:peroxiredoxin